jgi:hypothetical protein
MTSGPSCPRTSQGVITARARRSRRLRSARKSRRPSTTSTLSCPRTSQGTATGRAHRAPAVAAAPQAPPPPPPLGGPSCKRPSTTSKASSPRTTPREATGALSRGPRINPRRLSARLRRRPRRAARVPIARPSLPSKISVLSCRRVSFDPILHFRSKPFMIRPIIPHEQQPLLIYTISLSPTVHSSLGHFRVNLGLSPLPRCSTY